MIQRQGFRAITITSKRGRKISLKGKNKGKTLKMDIKKSRKRLVYGIFSWRRRRDSNPRASFEPAYALSRGASSPLEYFSKCNVLFYIKLTFLRCGGEDGIRTHGSFESLVFKTSSLNRSDTSPRLNYNIS